MTRDKWTQVLDELDECGKLMALWVIVKDDKMAGRITARYSKSGGTVYVTFQLFGWVIEGGKGIGVYGHERMTGCGYNRTETGIAEILGQNRERLKEEYGIELTDTGGVLSDEWRKDFKAGGYEVIRVL